MVYTMYEKNLKKFLVLSLLVIIIGVFISIFIYVDTDIQFYRAAQCYALLFFLYIVTCSYLFKL